MQKVLLVLAVVVLCLGSAVARPKGSSGRSHQQHRNPADKACKIVAADGTEIASRDCGCDGESQYTCGLESTKLGPDGESYTFCYNTEHDFTAEQWTGPFKKACRIEFEAESIEDLERPCPCGGDCSTEAALTGFQINGESASAFFCEKPDRSGRSDSDEHEEDGDDEEEADQEETCVCLRDEEPRSDKHEHPVPCRVTVDGEEEVTKAKECGCAGEIQGECSVSKTFTDRSGRTVETKFCYQEPAVIDGSRTFTGVLSKACTIRAMDDSQDFHTSNCPCGAECLTDDLTKALTGFSVGGVESKAFFCQRQDRDNDEMDVGEVDESSQDDSHRDGFGHHQGGGRPDPRGEESTCVCLMQEGAECTDEINRRREEREEEHNQCPADREQRGRNARRGGGQSRDSRRGGGQGGNRRGGDQGGNRRGGNQEGNRRGGNQRGNRRGRK